MFRSRTIHRILVVLGALASQVSAQHVYWADLANNGTGRIARGNLDGSNVTDVTTTGFAQQPSSVAIDQIEAKIYWTDGLALGGNGAIHRANLNGSNSEMIVPNAGLSSGIAVDAINGKVYWTSFEGVYRANLDGSDVEPLIPPSGVGFGAYGVAVDLLHNRLFWTEFQTSPSIVGRILSADLDGTDIQTIYDVNGTGPVAIALNPAGGTMYWVDSIERILRRANLNGSGIVHMTPASGAEFPTGVAVDVDNGKVYWSLSDLLDGIGRIRRSNLDGSMVENYQGALFDPKGIVVRTTPGIISTSPEYCSIDARQPYAINNASIVYGWMVVDVLFSDVLPSPLGIEDFAVIEHNGTGVVPGVATVMSLGPAEVRVTLSEPIEPGIWTCVYNNGSGTKTCLGYLPADVNSDGSSSPVDILRLIDNLNGVIVPPYGNWQTDANRSGAAEPSDVLRVIDLLNGADAFNPWNGASLPPCP